MKCILLCAGYATRLYPLTENTPKALIEVGGKPILDRYYENLRRTPEVDEIIIITNNKFYNNFVDWAKDKEGVKVLNDGTLNNDDRLGAIGDTMYVLEQENIDDDILVSVADNVFEYEISDFVDYAKEKQAPCLVGSVCNDVETLKRMGVGTIDENNILTEVAEKPEEPKGNILLWALYYYPKDVLPLFKEYKETGHNMDSPGRFTEYLYKVRDEYVYVIDKPNYDIGDLKVLEEVRAIYENK